MIGYGARLIPRYNWDYRLADLLRAMTAIITGKPGAEEEVSRALGEEPLFTATGRTSLYAILKSLDIPAGARVGVPLYCCPVVFEAIREAGFAPRFIDINPGDFNLEVSDLERKKKGLSALVVVHMFGNPADMDAINQVCNGIPVIEDCAHALFSRYRAGTTGFFSTASFFSFRSGKYLSAGEGSAILCGDSSLRERIRKTIAAMDDWNLAGEIRHCLVTYVKSFLYQRPWYGVFSLPVGKLLDRRLNLTAKSGIKLKKIAKADLAILAKRIGPFPEKIERQRKNAGILKHGIPSGAVAFPEDREGCRGNSYQFPIRFTDSEKRDMVAAYLLRHGIDSAKYLDEVVTLAIEMYGYTGDCPVAEQCSKTTLVVPHYYTLSEKDIEYIAVNLSEAIHRSSR